MEINSSVFVNPKEHTVGALYQKKTNSSAFNTAFEWFIVNKVRIHRLNDDDKKCSEHQSTQHTE